MMKGPTPADGGVVGAKSGTSMPTHLAPFHSMIGLAGFHGLPLRSALALL